MVSKFSPASFTKNFGWENDCFPLYDAIRSGFRGGLEPVLYEDWRRNSELPDEDRELIPLRFFLFSQILNNNDYVFPDELVAWCASRTYTPDFDRLALFAFHLARSGHWRKSKWPDGRVAGWANEFIRDVVWRDGAWRYEEFGDNSLEGYIQQSIAGVKQTTHKMFTNYRHMLRITGVLTPGSPVVGPVPFVAGGWAEAACRLLWDRLTYDGELDAQPSEGILESSFNLAEGFKLLGASADQGRVIARLAASDYVKDGGIFRFTHVA